MTGKINLAFESRLRLASHHMRNDAHACEEDVLDRNVRCRRVMQRKPKSTGQL